jgi:hypothetical protein
MGISTTSRLALFFRNSGLRPQSMQKNSLSSWEEIARSSRLSLETYTGISGSFRKQDKLSRGCLGAYLRSFSPTLTSILPGTISSAVSSAQSRIPRMKLFLQRSGRILRHWRFSQTRMTKKLRADQKNVFRSIVWRTCLIWASIYVREWMVKI